MDWDSIIAAIIQHTASRPFALSILGVLACERKASPSQEPPAPPAPTQASTAQAPAPEEKGPIVIGSIGSLTDPEASFGVSVHNGIQLAVDEVNAAGGVKGRRIELLAYFSPE